MSTMLAYRAFVRLRLQVSCELQSHCGLCTGFHYPGLLPFLDSDRFLLQSRLTADSGRLPKQITDTL